MQFYAEQERLSRDHHECASLSMDRFLRRLAIIAGFVFGIFSIMATALALGFPDTPRYVWQIIVWICAASLAVLFTWFVWEINIFTIFTREFRRNFLKVWEFRWPIIRKIEQSSKADLAARVFHFRSYVDFGRLDEFQIKMELAFFNGNNEGVVVDRIIEFISCNGSYQSIHLPQPQLHINQTSDESRPLERFGVTLYQRVPRDLAPLLDQKLKAGMPFSFTLTDLMLWLRPASGGDAFAAKIWQGISCQRKQDYIVCEKIQPMARSVTA